MWFNIVCLLKISLHCFAFSRKKKKKKDCTNKHCVLNDFVVYFSSRDDTVQHVSSLQSIFRVHDSSAIPHSFFFSEIRLMSHILSVPYIHVCARGSKP